MGSKVDSWPWWYTRRIVIGASLAALCTALPACGGSSTSSGTASAAAVTHNRQFTGAPIVVSTATGVNTALASYPQIFAGVEGAARAINAFGGINGHELIVHTCNTQSDPNVEVACARQAVSAGSVAEVGDLVYANPDAFERTLNAAGIPDIATDSISPSQLTLPTSFPINFDISDKAACFNPVLSQLAGATKVTSAVLGLAASQGLNALNAQMAKNLHTPATLESAIGFAGSTSDFTPVVQRIGNEGAKLIVLNTSIPTTTSLISAAYQLGKRWSWCADFGAMSAAQALQLGAAARGMYLAGFFPPLTATAQYPILNQFLSDMKAEQAAGNASASTQVSNYNEGMLNGWLSVQILEQAAKTIHGAITRKSVLTALNTLEPNLGNLVSVAFARPVGSGKYARVFNPFIYLQRWDLGKQNWYLVPGGRTNALVAVGSGS
jgi:ABC-type branched-subunit amino acid transport system substrate-binding protein